MYKIISIVYVSIFLLSACGPSKKADSSTSKYDTIQLKYAKYLDVKPDEIRNLRLYRFIDRWMNTPYIFGGKDEKGIDCSAFVEKLLAEVYDVKLPRTSLQQFYTKHITKFSSVKNLTEGDLVFFKISDEPGPEVSHVGLYLQNDKFINATTTKGVIIANLNGSYWKKRLVAAGKVKLI
jgi:NlpC/P60 family